MSTNQQENPKLDPLKENELGQLEGGFSELAASAPEEESSNIFCPNNIGCKGTSTTAPQ